MFLLIYGIFLFAEISKSEEILVPKVVKPNGQDAPKEVEDRFNQLENIGKFQQ